MTSICCTIYEEQSLVYWTVCEAQSAQYARLKVYQHVENRLFCKEKSIYQCSACFACKHLVVWQNISQQQDISTKQQQLLSNSFQDSPILLIRFEVLNWHSVHGDAAQEVVSHPFPPAFPLACAASVLPFKQCQLRSTNCTVGLPA